MFYINTSDIKGSAEHADINDNTKQDSSLKCSAWKGYKHARKLGHNSLER